MDKEFKNSSDQFAHISHIVAASCYMLDEIAMFVFADAHEQLFNSKHYKHYIKYEKMSLIIAKLKIHSSESR